MNGSITSLNSKKSIKIVEKRHRVDHIIVVPTVVLC